MVKMNSCQKKDLMTLMELDFCLLEMSLFLDTHPDDASGIDYHNAMAKKCMIAREDYVRKYGPLSNDEISNCEYKYLHTPWPWDINYAKG